MIVSALDIEKVKAGRRTQMWLPVEHGELGELRPCKLEYAEVYPLQTAPFVKGDVSITVVRVKLAILGDMSDLDARRQGYMDARIAKDVWARTHGDANDAQQAWRVDFVRGDRREFLLESQTRYLNAKMGGARDYTYDPAKGARDEGRALSKDELKLLAEGAERRAAERKAQERDELASLPPAERLRRVVAESRRRGIDISSEARLIAQRVERAERHAS